MGDRILIDAVSSLMANIRKNIIGVSVPHAEDFVVIDGGSEISCTTLERLLPRRWLDNWMIAVAIQMSDKSQAVNYGHSIALDELEGSQPIARPLAKWREKIEDMRQQHQKTIHICPLYINGNHFTLLEVNDRERAVYHYDSMATQAVISGGEKWSRVGHLVQVRIGL
jgi:hypothetical protein